MKKLVLKYKRLLKDGFFAVFMGGMLSKMIAFLSSIVIVRMVDKSAYAALAYADNIYSYVILLSGFGMASAILKFCVNENQTINKAYYCFALKWGSLIQAILIGTFFFILMMIDVPFPGAKRIFIALIPYGFLYYLGNLYQSFLRTQFKNYKFAVSSFVQVLLTFVLSILLVRKIGVVGIAFSRAFAISGSILIFLPFVIRYFSQNPFYVLSKKEIYPFLWMSVSLLVSNVFSMIMPANESFLINNLIKDEIITANYKVANLIPSQLPFVTSTIMVYYFPIVARAKKNETTWKSICTVGISVFCFTLLIASVGVFLTPHIISIAYGNQYSGIENLSSKLWLVYFINAGFRMTPMNLLPALGYVRFNVTISIVSAIIHLGIDYICISQFGLNGAIFATAIVYLSTGAMYWIYLYRKCKRDI